MHIYDNKLLEGIFRLVNIVAADGMALKRQAISILNADLVPIVPELMN